MSVTVMSMVWKRDDLDPYEKLVLLSLADHSDDDGVCYPSIKRLCDRTGMKERGVQNVIRRLTEKGWLKVEKNAGRKGANLYAITPAPDAPRTRCTPAPDAPIPPHPITLTPAPDAPEPSITVNEPSDIDKRASETVRGILEEFASPAAVTSFMAYRKRRKAALTVTAARRLAKNLRAIQDDGGDCDDAIGLAEERGWSSIEPDWYFRSKGQQHGYGIGNDGRGGRASGNEMVAAFARAAQRQSGGGR